MLQDAGRHIARRGDGRPNCKQQAADDQVALPVAEDGRSTTATVGDGPGTETKLALQTATTGQTPGLGL